MARSDINVRIGASLKPLKKSLSKAERAIKSATYRMENIGNNLQRSVTIPFTLMAGAAVKSTIEIDKLRKGLIGMMGSSEAAATEFEKLRKLAKEPGLDLKSAVEGSVKLQAIGYSADKAREQMDVLANAIALVGGSGEALSGVTLAMTQILGKGKVHAEEINQMAERLPQIRKAMQDAFGTADTEKIQEMGLSAEGFIDGIINQLEKLPPAQKTVQDEFNHIRDDLMVLGDEIGTMLLPMIKKMIEYVKISLKWWNELGEGTKKTLLTIGGILAVGGPILGGLARFTRAVMTIFKLFGGWSAMAALLTPVGMTIAAITGAVLSLAAAIIFVANNGWPEFVNMAERSIKRVYNFAAEMGEKILNALMWPYRKIQKLLGREVELISYDNFKLDLPEKEFKGLRDVIFGVKEQAKKLNDELAKTTTMNFTPSSGVIGGGGGDPGIPAGSGPGNVLDTVSITANRNPSIISQEDAEKSLSFLKNTTGQALERVHGLFKDYTPKIVDTFKTIPENMGESMAKAFDYLGGLWEEYSESAGTALGQVLDIFDQVTRNKEQRLDNYYDKEKQKIEGSKLSEEEKAEAIMKLDKRVDAERRRLMRRDAIASKSKAIFEATINGILAVSKAVAQGNYVMAAVIGSLAAAQVSAIASQPLPALAKGGVASSEAAVRVGEYPGATFNPEVISPLDKLKNMIGGAMGDIAITLNGGWRVSGYELETVLEGARVSRSRLTG